MSEVAGRLENGWLGRKFRFAERGTTLARDTLAGVTTFIVMSYIIFVNPQILSFAGVEVPPGTDTIPFEAVLAVTCLVAGVMTIAMGLYTNYAYAIAPGLGLNATVAYSLVVGEGLSYPAAMGLIVVEGLAVTIFVLTGLREKVMEAIPLDLKKAIAIGIGLFIAFIGFVNSGIVVRGTPVVDLGRFTTWPILVAFFGLVLTVALRARGVRGDLLIGIIAATALATFINELSGEDAGFRAGATIPDDVYESPDLQLLGNFNLDAFTELAFISAVVWAFSLFMADFFDTMGTLVGVGKPAGYLDEQGRLPDIRKPLLVDSLAAVAGGASSASSATTYIESASGISVGGRTGWVSVVCGLLFFPFMFFAPIIGMVPPEATAPALIIVGFLMMTALTETEEEAERAEVRTSPAPAGGTGQAAAPESARPRRLAGIDFTDLGVGLAAALTIMVMPFSFSIADGIGFGFIAYVVVRAAEGRWREVHPFMWVASAAFALYFLVPLLQDNFDWI
ncbi:MAG TPA: NCS2 family permease [Gaiellaceae bacterium]|nr:NCS2 family permease [Gaiellaceae bacterium]